MISGRITVTPSRSNALSQLRQRQFTELRLGYSTRPSTPESRTTTRLGTDNIFGHPRDLRRWRGGIQAMLGVALLDLDRGWLEIFRLSSVAYELPVAAQGRAAAFQPAHL